MTGRSRGHTAGRICDRPVTSQRRTTGQNGVPSPLPRPGTGASPCDVGWSERERGGQTSPCDVRGREAGQTSPSSGGRGQRTAVAAAWSCVLSWLWSWILL